MGKKQFPVARSTGPVDRNNPRALTDKSGDRSGRPATERI